ncbi:proline racemase family protein [Metasolibacillus sp. FSL H7-0170]|uniref:proline racemase family protein n=1 Tax=Metasolibacillus sp. FSL H7-0170 TaxID=2921431 RepID=UPI0031591069
MVLTEKLVIKTIETHTMGDPTRIVVEGMPEVPGDSVFEKKLSLIRDFDFIRSSLILEPRGHRDMFGAILLPPTLPDADIGVVFMDTQSYLNMCGHGTMGVVTAILEENIIDKPGDIVPLKLETPAGLIEVVATRTGDKVTEVAITNVPAFSVLSDAPLEMASGKTIKLDIAFGGSFFAIVDINELEYNLSIENTNALAELGMEIKALANQQFKVQHPKNEGINTIDLILFVDKSKNEGINTKNLAIFGETQVARSACGTGLSAQMAAQFAKGKLGLNEPYNTESIIETAFKGQLINLHDEGNIIYVTPQIRGNADVIGKHTFILRPDDVLVNGFLLNRKETIYTLK